MKTFLLIAGELAIGISVYILWRKFMATKEEVLAVIQANHNVTIGQLAEIKTGVETLISQGGGGTGAADLDTVAAELGARQEEVNTALGAVRALLPGAEPTPPLTSRRR